MLVITCASPPEIISSLSVTRWVLSQLMPHQAYQSVCDRFSGRFGRERRSGEQLHFFPIPPAWFVVTSLNWGLLLKNWNIAQTPCGLKPLREGE
ncbi:hypothetical protein M1M86_01360, partial [Dehalococcoidales bacterium]|nr:hypothetical protein [Dehalococcoidales bacterium]